MRNFFKSALERFFSGDKKVESKAVTVEPVAQARALLDEAELPVTLTIWTIERNRYSAARALCTDVELLPSEATSLCEDILGYVLNTPNGESVVVEARTGSLVGHSLEVVRDGVCEMTKSQLNAQLDTAKKEFNRMSKVELSNDEFWKTIKMGSSEIEIEQDNQE